MQSLFLYSLVALAGFAGFMLSFFIRHKKKKGEHFVCPVNFDCDAVVKGEYSKFLGLPVELIGMAYYGLVTLSYLFFVSFPYLISDLIVFLVLGTTIGALLFSFYLTFIQAFLIKEWCTWCLASAGLCVIIFFYALFGSEFGFIYLLREYRQPIVIFHAIGAALGLGGATVADILFFKFLKDFRIAEWEADVLKKLSQIIWFALAVLVITGIGLYLPNADILNQTPKFLVKVIIVGIIILNGAFLNLYISPRLVKISFGEKHPHEKGELKKERQLAFAMGAISIVSWYSAFILGMYDPNIGFQLLLGIYLLIVAAAVLASQILEKNLASLD